MNPDGSMNALQYIGSQAVPEGSDVRYYSYAGRQIAVSLEKCLPCFRPWHFAPSSRVLVITVPGSSGEAEPPLQTLGMDPHRPVYRFVQAGRLPLRFYLQECPDAA